MWLTYTQQGNAHLFSRTFTLVLCCLSFKGNTYLCVYLCVSMSVCKRERGRGRGRGLEFITMKLSSSGWLRELGLGNWQDKLGLTLGIRSTSPMVPTWYVKSKKKQCKSYWKLWFHIEKIKKEWHVLLSFMHMHESYALESDHCDLLSTTWKENAASEN